jgi:hypothetical protein
MGDARLPRRRHFRGRQSLSRRGGILRTFGTLIVFFALVSLMTGLYLLEDSLAHPIAEQSTGLIAAACFLSNAAVLLFYVLRPRAKSSQGDSCWWRTQSSLSRRQRVPLTQRTVAETEERPELPFQRIYVDRARIRP